jgi:phospholipid transport system transporter-binding protein
MSQIRVDNEDNRWWWISGELCFSTVDQLLLEFNQIVKDAPPKIIDLSEVTHTDSAGLALLIEWLKFDKLINFDNIPIQLLSIAAVSGLQDLINSNASSG